MIVFELAIKSAGVDQQLKLLREQLKQINAELEQTADVDAYAKLKQEAMETDFLIRELVKSQKLLKKEFDQTQLPIGSVAALRLEYQNLVVAINNMSKADRQSDVGENAIKRAASLKKEITEVEESVGNFTGSVGNYTGGILKAFDALEELGGSLGQKAEVFNLVRQSITLTASASDKMVQVFKDGYAAIGDGIGQVKQYIQTVKDLRTVQAQAVKEGIENNASVQEIGKSAGSASANLAEAARSTNLMSAAGRILSTVLKATGIGLLIAGVVFLIDAFKKFAPLVDWVEKAVAGMSAAFDVAYTRSLQLAGGIGKIFSGNISEGFADVKGSVSGMKDEMFAAAQAGFELQGRFQDLEDTQKAYALESAKTEAAIRKLNVELSNKGKSDAQRLRIADEITKLEQKAFKGKEELLLREFQLEKEKLAISGRLSEEELNQVAAGNAAVIEVLEDAGKLKKDEADKVRELNIKLIESEAQTAEDIERINNRRATIQEQAKRKREELREKEEKALEAQLNRIRQLEKEILDADASTIINDFDRQIVAIEAKRQDALAKLSAEERQLGNKVAGQGGKLRPEDKLELDRISEATASFKAAYQLQIDAVEELRTKAQADAVNDLREIQLEVQALAEENAVKIAELETEAINSAFEINKAQARTRTQARLRELEEQYAAGKITKEKLERESNKVSYEASIELLAAEKERTAKQAELAQVLRDAKIDAANVTLEAQLNAIQAALDADIRALQERQKAQGIDLSAEIEAKKTQAVEEGEAARLEAEKKRAEAQKDLQNVVLTGAAEVDTADEDAHKKKLARIEDEKQKRKELQDFLLDSARTVAGAIFEIERNRTQAEFDEKVDKLNEEYDLKKEQAAGNADLLAKLEREQARKREALEKEAANDRKRIARTEAIVQGALAVVKALPNPYLAAAAAIATAAQIAVINSQKFAHGGALKLGLFGGRPHSAGGTKGVFDDGTQVEVEKDELFVVLNKRATKEYRRLSDLNYAHGGAKFAAGGVHDFTPQFAVPNQSGSSGTSIVVAQSGFTNEQVILFADTVAQRTGAESRKAIAEGLDDANRTKERNLALTESTTI